MIPWVLTSVGDWEVAIHDFFSNFFLCGAGLDPGCGQPVLAACAVVLLVYYPDTLDEVVPVSHSQAAPGVRVRLALGLPVVLL